MTSATNNRPVSGKIVLLIMGLAALAMVVVMLIAQSEVDRQTPVAMDWSQRGLSYGEGRAEVACMKEAVNHYEDCEGRACRAQWGIFFARCLERSSALEGRCVGVPDIKDKLQTVSWREGYCRRLDQNSNAACLELAQWAHKFCLQ